jgi:hypothetical protein
MGNIARLKTTETNAVNVSILDEITWRAGEGVPFSFVAKRLQRAENCSTLGDTPGMEAALTEILLCVLAGAPEDLATLVRPPHAVHAMVGCVVVFTRLCVLRWHQSIRVAGSDSVNPYLRTPTTWRE